MTKKRTSQPKPTAYIGIHLPPDTLLEIRKAAALQPSDSNKKSVSGMCRATLVKAFPVSKEA